MVWCSSGWCSRRRAGDGHDLPAPCAGAADTAARMAATCYDLQSGGLLRITDRHAKAALRRGFEALLRAGGVPQAMPVTQAEAEGFPHHRGQVLPGGVTWLAVGFDADRRAAYALQSARDDMGDDDKANDAARTLALIRLADLTASRGFPMGEARGTA